MSDARLHDLANEWVHWRSELNEVEKYVENLYREKATAEVLLKRYLRENSLRQFELDKKRTIRWNMTTGDIEVIEKE